MALLRVCEGSRHIRTFPGLVGVLSLSRTTMLDIQSVGCDQELSYIHYIFLEKKIKH